VPEQTGSPDEAPLAKSVPATRTVPTPMGRWPTFVTVANCVDVAPVLTPPNGTSVTVSRPHATWVAGSTARRTVCVTFVGTGASSVWNVSVPAPAAQL